MIGRRLQRTLLASSVLGMLVFAGGTACTAKKNTEIVVAVQTDLRVPKDLNAVTIRVLSKGAVQYQESHEVGPTGLHLPATIGLVPQNEDDLQPIEVQIIGQFSSDPDPRLRAEKVVRKTRMTFAKNRVGLVRIPLKFACYDGGDCGEGKTCIAGACAETPLVEGATMPQYAPEAVFGSGGSEGQQGACWNADACFSSASVIAPTSDPCVYSLVDSGPAEDAGVDSGSTTPDASVPDTGGDPGGDATPCPPVTCADLGAECGTIGDGCGGIVDCGKCAAPAVCGAYFTNKCGVPDAGADAGFYKIFDPSHPISVVLAGGPGGLGYCDATSCRVALDFDPQEGWSYADESKTKIRLAPGICEKVAKNKLRVEATDACPTKTSELSLCEGTGNSGGDGGVAPMDASTGEDSSTTCKPSTCAMRAWECGTGSDGCGNLLECGTCPAGVTCDPASHRCMAGGADASTCPFTMCFGACTDTMNDPANCGACGNKCTGGPCIGGTCTGSGTDAGTCTPKTCAMYGATCGSPPDGCGGVLPSCGTCTAPAVCSGSFSCTTSGDGGAMSDTCGLTGSSTPPAGEPLIVGYHLASPTFGAEMNGGPALTVTSLSAGPTVPACAGSSAQFSGSSFLDGPALGPAGSLGSKSTSLTVTAWVQFDPAMAVADAQIVSTLSGTSGFGLGYDSSGTKLAFQVYVGGVLKTVTTSALPASGWHRITGRYGGGSMGIVVDTTPGGTTPVSGAFSPAPSIVIGGKSSAGPYWKGPIGEVRVYAM